MENDTKDRHRTVNQNRMQSEHLNIFTLLQALVGIANTTLSQAIVSVSIGFLNAQEK